MIRQLWDRLCGRKDNPPSTTDQVNELLKKSEDMKHEAEIEAVEAEQLTASLQEMRVQNRFKERMVLKIQGGLR